MKQILFYSALVVLLIASCKKDKEIVAQRPQTVQDFVGKYLICDSVVTQNGSGLRKEVFGEGKGLDVLFKTDGTFEVYFASGFVNKAAYVLRNDTLFGWKAYAANTASPYPFDEFKLVVTERDRLMISDDRRAESKKKFYYRLKTSGGVMPKPMTGKFQDFIGKTLYCDSMVITDGDFTRQIWYYGAGKGEDIMFFPTGFIGRPGPSTTSNRRYEFQAPDTLYQWLATLPRFPIDFIMVKTPSDKKLNTIERSGVKTKENFYTVAQ